VSPIIQAGALLPVVISKNAPTHCDWDTCVSLKSAGLIAHDRPPNDMVTLTCVLQAVIKMHGGVRGIEMGASR
jgi:hypothetical protein